ncbi:uncharacterized protein LOC134773240 isoform X2 [Penaeus indicus]|uniref:uncharacterized protein LOC134773240 isoform X2 n=1 Tax=Penaeus indicus TaxID=29960 RepID=UPI00300C6F7C
MDKIWKSNLARKFKIQVFCVLIEPILLYGSKTWTLSAKQQCRLDGCYTRLLRRVLNLSWRNHPTLEMVYGDLPRVSTLVCKRRVQFAGCCARATDELVSSFVFWRHPSSDNRSRKLTFPDRIRRDTSIPKEDLLGAMTDKQYWKGVSACEEKTTRVLEGCIPLPLPDEIVTEVVPKAKDYALLHGAGMRFKDTYNPDILQMAPFFLLPSAFPRREFDRVVKLQPLINVLMHRIAHDHEFLESALKNTIKVDDFTAKLWDIYLTVREEGVSQDMSLGLVRSDVMLTKCHAGCCELCQTPPYVTGHQVEVNTIASGFGHMGPISGSIHRYTKDITRITFMGLIA